MRRAGDRAADRGAQEGVQGHARAAAGPQRRRRQGHRARADAPRLPQGVRRAGRLLRLDVLQAADQAVQHGAPPPAALWPHASSHYICSAPGRAKSRAKAVQHGAPPPAALWPHANSHLHGQCTRQGRDCLFAYAKAVCTPKLSSMAQPARCAAPLCKLRPAMFSAPDRVKSCSVMAKLCTAARAARCAVPRTAPLLSKAQESGEEMQNYVKAVLSIPDIELSVSEKRCSFRIWVCAAFTAGMRLKECVVQVSSVEVLSPGALFGTMRQSANGAGKVRALYTFLSLCEPRIQRDHVPSHMHEALVDGQHYHAIGEQHSHDQLSLSGLVDQLSDASFNVHKR